MRTIATPGKLLITGLFIHLSAPGHSQVTMNTTAVPYTQNFNSVPASATNSSTVAFVNNSTIPGWYSSETQIRTQLAGSTRNNTGDLYCVVSGTDKSIGTRPSGSTGTIDYGVRLLNNTGNAVTSVQISYSGEQWSIAENNGNVNFISIGYRVGSNITSSTAGTWTNIGALQFSQLYGNSQSAALGGTTCGGTSNQCLALNGNLAANRQQLTACLAVNIPAGQEIFIRWADADNSANDHHLQIDDVSITFFDVSCSVVLPVTWVDIKAAADEKMNARIEWSVASEHNNDYFEVLMASDEAPVFQTVGKVMSAGDTDQLRTYSFDKSLIAPGNYYFRILQTDLDGKKSYSAITSLNASSEDLFVYCESGTSLVRFSRELKEGTILSLYDLTGRIINSVTLEDPILLRDFDMQELFNGYLIIGEKESTSSFMVVFN